MRKYKVLISELAREEIDQITYYIEETVSEASADRVSRSIWKGILSLERFPWRGNSVGQDQNLRITPVKKYKYYLIYDINDIENTVVVHHVVHQHQNLNKFVLK